ncbi:molybdopterin molybdotransferase [Saccharopolyspora antimicrobica]|uniref:Molybdopterin molybdenumtransferase n=1 Tax=Saccharopolyspora antimicrobica TaxID=455193 RepID=A0A1I5CQB1_9PSEU|nr:molybdopterin molybdotransferase MoeA [Saccharopolyspora antimicrobica]RKT88785.1 molybdopterin molybdotransferase [Saccharopolyspora antimicrobica]SFN89148.1 molybdopterin molybdotransferase [Saccharopolyspora antimicrobica]
MDLATPTSGTPPQVGALPTPTWAQARETARTAARALPAVARDLPEALGHLLAEPLAARTDLPAFDTSAMDGWAVAGPGPWQLRDGRVLAGARAEPLADGTALGIATGAELPPGTTAVLRREDGQVDPSGTTLSGRAPAPGRDIRPRGQECRAGQVLLPPGTAVTPAVLGLAAAAGHDRIAVHRRPVVELLVLGDELLDSGPPRDGRVRDALSPLLGPWLRCGGELTGSRRIPDDFDLLRTAIADSPADVVITTGGTAAGPADFLHRALAELGARFLVDSVAVRPGHPMLLAELPPTGDGRARWLAGLPGNPLAAVAGTATLVQPLLDRLNGRAEAEPRRFTAAADLPGHPRDTKLLPVELRAHTATALPFGGPAMLRGLALSDGLAVVPPGGLAAGSAVEVLETPRPW